jgi:hypothetical protein
MYNYGPFFFQTIYTTGQKSGDMTHCAHKTSLFNPKKLRCHYQIAMPRVRSLRRVASQKGTNGEIQGTISTAIAFYATSASVC